MSVDKALKIQPVLGTCTTHQQRRTDDQNGPTALNWADEWWPQPFTGEFKIGFKKIYIRV